MWIEMSASEREGETLSEWVSKIKIKIADVNMDVCKHLTCDETNWKVKLLKAQNSFKVHFPFKIHSKIC